MNLFKKFITVASGTFLSRLLGFLREIFMAFLLGTGPIADAFNAAFRFPNTFRRLFAEGALSSAFIPLLSKKIETDGICEAKKFSEEVLGVLFTILILLTLLIEFSMPFLVHSIIAPGFLKTSQKFTLTVQLSLIMFPYLACMSLASLMAGILNALKHYFVSAITPVFLNILLITVLLYAWTKGLSTERLGLYLSWGVLLAGILQLVTVTLAVRCAGISLKLRMPVLTKSVKRLLRLALPAAITGGITQINLLVSTSIASRHPGAISSLIYADRLYQLPLGIVGVSVATVLLPELSRALRSKKFKTAHSLQNRSIEFTLLLSLPAALGFLILSEPIVRLLFQHGHFTIESTIIVASILKIYGLGLPAFVLIKSFIPSYFAREDTKSPMLFAFVSVLGNIILSLSLFPYLGVKGIVISEVISGWLNAGLLFTLLVRRADWKADAFFFKRILIIVLATSIMSIFACLISDYYRPMLLSKLSFVKQTFLVIQMIGSSITIYFFSIFLFGWRHLLSIKNLLFQKNI